MSVRESDWPEGTVCGQHLCFVPALLPGEWDVAVRGSRVIVGHVARGKFTETGGSLALTAAGHPLTPEWLREMEAILPGLAQGDGEARHG